MNAEIPNAPLLFTPGPLTTSPSVKAAMLRDAGSWHFEFNARVKWIREQLLSLAEVSRADGWEAVLLQGSGTYGVESVFASCVPPHGKVCVLANGAYGERMAAMLKALQISHSVLRAPENEWHDLDALDQTLSADDSLTHLAVVHCETTTGILNPIDELGQLAKRHCLVYVVDAMSSFGALPIDLDGAGVHFLISSANKCLEGVPGFCFVLARRETLLANETHERSLSLNLIDQWRAFERNGQFRYTPPTHVLLAFEQALKELAAEGGIPVRCTRYQRNHALLVAGMRALGFEPYLRSDVQSCIITAFHYPSRSFAFPEFYQRLSQKGFIIYPGKISSANTFRIGNIGHLFEPDIRALLDAIAVVSEQMGLILTPATSAPLPQLK